MQNQIESVIAAHGYTVRGMARKLHIPLKDFQAKLSGAQDFTLEEAHQLASSTGTSIDHLFFDDMDSDLVQHIDLISHSLKYYSATNAKRTSQCAHLAWVFVSWWIFSTPAGKKEGKEVC